MTAASTDAPVALPLARTVARPPDRRRGRRRAKRVLLILAGLAGLGSLVYAWLPKPQPVEVATVRYVPLEVSISDDGRTRVRERIVVSAPITGKLSRLALEPGTQIESGQILAQIAPPDPPALDAHSRAATEAHVTAGLARQRQAEAAIARAKVARAQALRDVQRTVALTASGAVTGVERERAELAAELATNDLAQSELTRAAATAEVAASRAALGRGDPGTAVGAFVTAPVRGTLLRVVRVAAGPVVAGAPLVELGDLAAMEVVVDVLSSDAARLRVGAAAEITEWGGERPLAGRVRAIEPSAFTRISALGIEEQRVNVIVAIDAPPAALGDGFRVEIRMVVWHGDHVLAVPASALFRDRARWAVYVVRAGRAQLQPVEIGQRAPNEVEVVRGLAAGDVVILHPSDRVADGVRVAAR